MTNSDSSATSNALPHSGQFGRLKFEVASAWNAEVWRADWTIIVDLLDALSLHPIEQQRARSGWRCDDVSVKLP
jgi:hypothetical protein